MINYNDKKFVVVNNSENGETDNETTFHYYQIKNRVWATYSGGKIIMGHLIGKVNNGGVIDMRYHHMNTSLELLVGKCISTPEIMENLKLRMHEQWTWTEGREGNGYSIIQEI